jgi:hypothetical protein
VMVRVMVACFVVRVVVVIAGFTPL